MVKAFRRNHRNLKFNLPDAESVEQSVAKLMFVAYSDGTFFTTYPAILAGLYC